MFGPYTKNKALCSCGVITDLDEAFVARKRSLRKRVECPACRNRRIALEMEELDRHFQGLDEDHEEWGAPLVSHILRFNRRRS